MLNRLHFPTALASAVALASLGFAAQGDEGFSPPGYAKAQGPLFVAHDATLLDVVLAYEELAGQTIVLEGNAQETLRGRPVHLSEDLEVRGPRAHAALEILLTENRFAVTLEGSEDAHWLAIHDLTAADTELELLREHALPVSSAALLRMREHPALLVTTTVELPGVSVRQVSNALRTALNDTKTQRLAPAEGSGGLQITGCGRWAATMLAALRLPADSGRGEEAAHEPARLPSNAGDPLLIESDSTLHDVLLDYGRLTSRRFACAEETLAHLKRTRLNFSDGLSVKPQSARRVVELLLFDAGFVVTNYGVDEVELFGVASSSGRQNRWLRSGAEFVPADRLAEGRLFPARLITTVVQLPGIDARQLSNSMRTMTTDANIQSMLPLGNTDRLFLTGFAPWVSATAELLDTMSAVASGEEADVGRSTLAKPPAPTGPLRVEPGSTMLDVLRQYEGLTGQRFLFDQENRGQLETQRVELLGPLTVPPRSVHEVFELLASQNDFALTDLQIDEPRLMGISRRGRGNTLRTGAVLFTGQPGELRAHPARLFVTPLHLPGIDVRQLSNSTRTLIVDANTQQILPAGNTHFMLLTGFGPQLAALAETLQGALAPEDRPAVRTGEASGLELPESSAPLRIEEGATLLDVLTDYEGKTGVHFLFSRHTRTYLSQSLARIPGAVTIPSSSAQAALEVLIAAGGFLMRVHDVAEPRLVTISLLEMSEHFWIRASARPVPESRVAELTQHRATLVTTVVHLPGAPVRELCNSLRSMVTDANTQLMVPMGSSDYVALMGVPAWVDGTARLLRVCAQLDSAPKSVSLPAFPEIRESFRLRRETALIEVVREYERITGKLLVLERRTLDRLTRESAGVPQDLDVPPARAQSTFESLLLEGGFVLTVHERCAPLELSVIPLDGVGRSILGSALFVPEARLEALRAHPGLFVQTAIELPGVDVQQLAKSPKGAAFNELPARSMVAVGQASRVVLVGPGSEVFALADALRRAVPGSDERQR